MGDLGRENAYNYELQRSTFFNETLKLQNNDVLTTTCIYNSMDRNKATKGGLSSQEEMCVIFSFVYPAQCCAPPLSPVYPVVA
jgi:hypothetical protein